MKLSTIVSECLDTYNLGKHEYARFYRFGVRAVRNMKWDVTGKPCEIEIPVDCDLTCKLPDDFIKEHKVCVRGHSGELRALTRNNQLSVLADGHGRFLSYRGFHDGYIDTPFKGRYVPLFSSKGDLRRGTHQNIGEFKIDMSCGRIILNPEFCYDCIVLVYMSNSDGDGDIEVNEFASEAIHAFIAWQYKVGSSKYSQGERISAQVEYGRQKKLANLRIKRPMMQDINQAIRQSNAGGIRR